MSCCTASGADQVRPPSREKVLKSVNSTGFFGVALAVKLFELGRLSSGQAAALVPMERAAFLHSLPQWGVSAVNWDEEEFADEVRHA